MRSLTRRVDAEKSIFSYARLTPINVSIFTVRCGIREVAPWLSG